MPTVTGFGGGVVTKRSHFRTCVGSPRFKSANVTEIGGSWSRNAEVSSLLDWGFVLKEKRRKRREQRGEERRGEERGERKEERGEETG